MILRVSMKWLLRVASLRKCAALARPELAGEAEVVEPGVSLRISRTQSCSSLVLPMWVGAELGFRPISAGVLVIGLAGDALGGHAFEES